MYRKCLTVVQLFISISIINCHRYSEGMHPELKEPPTFSILLVTAPYVGHLIPLLALGEELVQRGHNVTLVSAPTDFVLRQVERYNINLWSIGEDFEMPKDLSTLQSSAGKNTVNTQFMHGIKHMINFQKHVIKTIDHPIVKSFDIIVGDTANFICLMCFSYKWNITGIYLTLSMSATPFDFNAWPFPSVQSGYSDNLTFIQRLISSINAGILSFVIKSFISVYSMISNDNICKRNNIPLGQLVYYANYHPQLIIVNFGFEFPRATLPLTDYVGPMIPQLQPQLPQDIAEWLDSRVPTSVVYISMGTTAELTSVQAEMIINGATQADLSVLWSLRKRNQHILQHMTYDPKKVLISEWVPQVTVLKHPSIHSAILHGGLGGVQEALSCRVPIISIPFLYDHIDNAVRVQHYHYGEMIYLHELTTSLVTQKLKLIESDLYQKSLVKIQKIYKKDGGASRAADLVEFYSDVGYEHLVPSYAKYNWSWVEFYNVDVYAVLLLAVLLPSYILYQVIRRCCSSIVSTSKKKVE